MRAYNNLRAQEIRNIENKKLRKLLYLTHLIHFKYLYGDDGEMQCAKCMLDFKRDPIEKIERQLIAPRNKDLCDGRCIEDPERYGHIRCIDCKGWIVKRDKE